MKAYWFCIIVIGVVLLANSALAESSRNIAISVTPLRKVYHPGEPIAVTMVARNTGEEERLILFDYPRRIGVTFTCQDAARSAFAGQMDFGGAVQFRPLPAGKEIRHVIALNRYLDFEKAQRYIVEYAELFARQQAKMGGQHSDAQAEGKFVIAVESGPVDEKWIEELTSALERREPSTGKAESSLKKNDAIPKEDIMELLQWSHTPLVIEPLIVGAQNVPNTSADVVRGLRKFFKQHERARSGILELAQDSDIETFQTATGVYEQEEVAIPGEWFKPVLTGRSIGKICVSLQYLKKHGQNEDASLVEPLTHHENKQISSLASVVVKELHSRQKVATPSMPKVDKK